MPRLLAFLACEKVIIEKEHETPSLISILQKVMFQPNEGIEVPVNAIAPFKWSVFTIWDREQGDVGKTFHQKCELTMPDGTAGPITVDLPFTVKDEINFNVANVLGFPIGQLGTITITMWLESESGEAVTPRHIYPVRVERVTPVVQSVTVSNEVKP